MRGIVRSRSKPVLLSSILFCSWVSLAPLATPAFAQAAAPQPEEKTIAVFGQSIHYWDVGSGSAVVLLHGLGSRKDDWARVLEPLSKNHRVVVPDQIGFGKSDKPLLDYKIQTYVDFLNEFLRQLKIDRATLVGESMGGWIAGLDAIEAVKNPHLVPVDKLILVDSAGLPWEGASTVPSNLNPATLEEMRALMKSIFYDTSWMTDDILRGIFTSKLSQHDGYTVHALLSGFNQGAEMIGDKLGEIRIPTLVVWGRQDALLPLSTGQRYADGVAGARLVVIDKCGHVPAAEQPQQFVAAVSDFLDAQH